MGLLFLVGFLFMTHRSWKYSFPRIFAWIGSFVSSQSPSTYSFRDSAESNARSSPPLRTKAVKPLPSEPHITLPERQKSCHIQGNTQSVGNFFKRFGNRKTLPFANQLTVAFETPTLSARVIDVTPIAFMSSLRCKIMLYLFMLQRYNNIRT